MPRDAAALYRGYLDKGRVEHKIKSKIKTGRHWYGLPRYFRPRKTWLSNRSEQQQYDLDVAMWYGAFEKSSDDIRGFLARIYGILSFGGLLFRDGVGNWKLWSDCDIPVASALSHGGRVMIQLPESDNEGFWEWLWGNVRIRTRFAATHGVLFLPVTEAMPNGQSKLIKEAKKDHNVRQHGINIGMGGVGNINPWSGVEIDDVGEHGHLYLGYRAPSTETVGVLLVGCEGSAPMDMYRRGRHGFAKDQTGHKHTFGSSGKFSPTGGMKWKKIGWHGGGPCNGAADGNVADSMYVDLTVGGWEFLKDDPQCNFTPNKLGETAAAPRAPEQLLPDKRFPSRKKWKLWSEVLARTARRTGTLAQIDREVRTYTETLDRDDGTHSEKRLSLDVIASLCDEYHSRRARRLAARNELKIRTVHHRNEIDQEDYVPGKDEWMRWSAVLYSSFKDSRSALLIEIDSEVGAYEQLRGNEDGLFQTHLCMNILKELCQIYQPRRVRRQLACEDLARRVNAELERLGDAPEDTHMPDHDEWKLWSRVNHGARGARSSALKMIDTEVTKYDELKNAVGNNDPEKRICLNTILKLCDGYDTEKVRRRAARDELKKRTEGELEWLTDVPFGLPKLDEWKRWSNSGGRRPTLIREIDQELSNWWSASEAMKAYSLPIIKANCELYSVSSNPDARRLSACDELRRQIDAKEG